MLLTQKQIELFEQYRYLTLEDFVSLEACESLRERASEIVEDFLSYRFSFHFYDE